MRSEYKILSVVVHVLRMTSSLSTSIMYTSVAMLAYKVRMQPIRANIPDNGRQLGIMMSVMCNYDNLCATKVGQPCSNRVVGENIAVF